MTTVIRGQEGVNDRAVSGDDEGSLAASGSTTGAGLTDASSNPRSKCLLDEGWGSKMGNFSRADQDGLKPDIGP